VLLIVAEPLKAAGIKGAGVYGIAMFTGVGAIPVAVGATLFKKDTSEAEFKATQEAVFAAALRIAGKNGRVISQDRQKGLIRAKISGADISIDISGMPSGGSRVTVSARKYFIPKPELASGLLYEIKREIE
ncbi:MAG: hypothetical protein PHF11_03565, partial [Candidatus Omnitrophica bacterium]|nr:hypothetical protein [Candidatus Omnitrophota bacterium]